jgi:hypothetical protein
MGTDLRHRKSVIFTDMKKLLDILTRTTDIQTMRLFPLLLLLCGCYASPSEVVRNPSNTWDATDCLIVIGGAMQHNLRDKSATVYYMATAYTPEVIRAITRLQQLRDGFGDSTAYERTYGLTVQARGLYVDRGGKPWNRMGGDHPDSLLLVLNLYNPSYPCQSAMFNGRPLMGMADQPCPQPDISNIGQMARLVGGGDTLLPSTIWGRQHNTLTTEEHLILIYRVSDVANPENLHFELGELR